MPENKGYILSLQIQAVTVHLIWGIVKYWIYQGSILFFKYDHFQLALMMPLQGWTNGLKQTEIKF